MACKSTMSGSPACSSRREAGVRGLKKQLAAIARWASEKIVSNEAELPVTVHTSDLEELLGRQVSRHDRAQQDNPPGVVTGLAWTPVGGEILFIKATDMPGSGEVTLTGQLGDVMKESVEAARTVVRSRARVLGIKDEVFEKRDIHVHVPDGATPKDGPSAGAAMTTAIVSALTGIPVRGDVAMTGEITLRGEVTAIGGLKEKLLAALRGGIKTVLIPEENVKDLQDIPANVKEALKIVPVRWIDKVLEVALERQPSPLLDDDVAPAAVEAAAAPAVAKKTTERRGAVKH